MAAIWTTKVTVLDVDEKEISLSATVVDGEFTATYNVITARIDGPKAKQDVMQNIWEQYARDMAKNTKVATLISGVEAQVKTWLEKQVL